MSRSGLAAGFRVGLVMVCLSLSGWLQGVESRVEVALQVFSTAPCCEVVLVADRPGADLVLQNQDGQTLHRGRRIRVVQGPAGEILLDGKPSREKVLVSGPLRLENGRTLRRTRLGATLGSGENGLRVVVRLSFEEYLAGVLAAESAPWAGLPMVQAAAYLAAQAVASRSYALFFAGRDRHHGAHFCDSTHCQAWRDPQEQTLLLRAVRETEGKALFLGSEPAPAFYASTMGERSLLPGEVWGHTDLDRFFKRVPGSLPGETRPLAFRSPHASWVWRVSERQLSTILGDAFGFVWDGGPIRIERTAGGIAGRIFFGHESVQAEEFRLAFCRAVHWGSLRSLWFDAAREGAEIVFTGKGLGHSVGMCQYGALELAARGWGYRRILSWYYPVLAVKNVARESYPGRIP